jgi:hypothetical protein
MKHKSTIHADSVWVCTSRAIPAFRTNRFGRIPILLSIGAAIFLGQAKLNAGSGTWIMNPVNNSWNTPANWSSNTVPSGLDTATFAISNTTDISISATSSAFALNFNPGASAYNFTALPGDSLSIGGGGMPVR